jgi:hypothetical protein
LTSSFHVMCCSFFYVIRHKSSVWSYWLYLEIAVWILGFWQQWSLGVCPVGCDSVYTGWNLTLRRLTSYIYDVPHR